MDYVRLSDNSFRIDLDDVEGDRLTRFCNAAQVKRGDLIVEKGNALLKDLERWCHYNKTDNVEGFDSGSDSPS